MRSTALDATQIEQQTFDAGHDSMRMGCSGTFDQLADACITVFTEGYALDGAAQ